MRSRHHHRSAGGLAGGAPGGLAGPGAVLASIVGVLAGTSCPEPDDDRGGYCVSDALDPDPAPDPGPPAPPPAASCGAPAFPGRTTARLRRYPYLQSITATSARIAWTATLASTGRVRLAPAAAGPPWPVEVDATAETFDTDRTGDTEDYVAFDAVVEGLEPGQAYCYEVVTGGEVVATGLTLHTAWEGDQRPVRILAFGDSGELSPEQQALRDAFMGHEFDVFLHLGDMAYERGTHPQFEARVFEIYRELMHRVPSFPTIGNHEYGTDDAQPYLDVYYLFEQALRERDMERYYGFDYGNVHFVSLDSNDWMLDPIRADRDGDDPDDMIDWLRQDLAASAAPWKIAFFHHPPFSQVRGRGRHAGVTDVILPALYEGGVDLVLVGHDHHYLRSLPLRGECEVPDPDAEQDPIPFVVVGSGGTELHPVQDPRDWYVAHADDTVHAFLSLTVHGCGAVGEAIDIEGRTVDRFELNGCD